MYSVQQHLCMHIYIICIYDCIFLALLYTFQYWHSTQSQRAIGAYKYSFCDPWLLLFQFFLLFGKSSLFICLSVCSCFSCPCLLATCFTLPSEVILLTSRFFQLFQLRLLNFQAVPTTCLVVFPIKNHPFLAKQKRPSHRGLQQSQLLCQGIAPRNRWRDLPRQSAVAPAAGRLQNVA